ncbi:hypothetical protein T01_6769 [Trichinella spiralis]|uniref:Uncharacterized protein n=1 Tax=Trichinella spiralis TaxID=6334 RepID=A0A0V1B8X3_TRISP|nr:hypothetical protein T01_6769 [Trichinella spiralis]
MCNATVTSSCIIGALNLRKRRSSTAFVQTRLVSRSSVGLAQIL